MRPLFVTFYTEGSPYAGEAITLGETCATFGLPFERHPMPSRGSWARNCNAKPTFLREMMVRHEGRPLVWLDADARVRRLPVAFDACVEMGTDFAAHWRYGQELLSGTMYWGGGPRSWELLRLWLAECEQHPETWDQRNLQAVIERGVPGLRVERLPETYTAIFDAGVPDPVIEHMQASRRLRELMNA